MTGSVHWSCPTAWRKDILHDLRSGRMENPFPPNVPLTAMLHNRVGGGPSYSMSRWPAYVHASMPACRPYRAYRKNGDVSRQRPGNVPVMLFQVLNSGQYQTAVSVDLMAVNASAESGETVIDPEILPFR